MTIGHADSLAYEPRKRVAVIVAPVGDDRSTGADRTIPRGPGARSERQKNSRARLTAGQERTLAALEQLFPVSFELVGPSELSGVDGLLVLGPAPIAQAIADRPRLVLHPDGPLARASRTDISAVAGERTPIALADGPELARPLRGRTIPERSLPEEPRSVPAAGSLTLAKAEGRSVWWQLDSGATPMEVSSYPLAELGDGEALRDHLRAGCFMGLLPLVHFLGKLLGEDGWKPPPLCASFVVDDPNLHRASYGFLKYRELVAHATRHGYHVGLATVPLDGWFVDGRAASLLAGNTSVLSLLVHGNDHVARELGRLSTDAAAVSSIAQGLRRIAALERRSGVSVDRVMAPPHGACSEAALRAMFRLGMEAACISRPHPWRDGQPAATPLLGWRPAELVAGGLPVLPRYPLSATRDDLALRALLGQPLILYGHHGDFAQGLDVLAQATSEINALGEVRWGSLSSIARQIYATRRMGETLLVHMHTRRVAVEVPAGVSALRVVVDEPFGGAAGHRLVHPGGTTTLAFEHGPAASELLAVDAPTSAELTLAADLPLNPEDAPARAFNPWPWIRRALVETRDRLQPLR